MSHVSDKLQRLDPVLRKVWSLESSTGWTPENPAKGQCAVTSLVVQDLFGGELLKTPTCGGTHFYNRIDGQRYDLTLSQFAEPIQHMDELTTREEAFTHTNEQQYGYLRESVRKCFE